MFSNLQPSPRRGRPRSDAARRAVLDAAAELSITGGAGANVDAIAARAGVSRTTVYKWWPSAAAVLLEGLLERTHGTLEAPSATTTREALESFLSSLILLVRDTPAGVLLRGLIAASAGDPGVGRALVDDWIAPRRAAIVTVLTEGQRRGEVRAGLELDAVVDALFAPIYYRLMLGHEPLTDSLPTDILVICWPGISTEKRTES